MQYIKSRMLDRELKKGSAELLILSLVEDQPRHGYDLSKLIEARSGGVLKFRVASLYPLLYRLEKRGWIAGRWIEKAGQRRRRYYRLTPAGAGVLASQRGTWRDVRRGDQPHRGSRPCLSGLAGSTKRCASTWTTSTTRCARAASATTRRCGGSRATSTSWRRCERVRWTPSTSDVRFALRTLRKNPGLHRRRHADAGARHRRDDRDLHASSTR